MEEGERRGGERKRERERGRGRGRSRLRQKYMYNYMFVEKSRGRENNIVCVDYANTCIYILCTFRLRGWKHIAANFKEGGIYTCKSGGGEGGGGKSTP